MATKAGNKGAHGGHAGHTGHTGHSGPGAHSAHGVDDDIKQAALARLKRIEGQVRGIHKMIEEERYCADVLVQLSSVQEALRGVAKEMLRNHLKHCATHELSKGGAGASHMVDELVELMHKHNR